ncbi:hypothetical protein [Lewinella sp. 4G2]|uniref:hypothetical protein n=1 Tax=Lewinella sp. 4G2 TaxID=1803372 RepID=UPI0007B4C400|nr:hypothetical protein [Lewinella sp. 4G2]OAV43898.1 hypothetical protein A3850_005055 [Lewinella sp. 4G2]
MPFAEDDLVRRLRNGDSTPEPAEKDALWAAIGSQLPVAPAAAPTASGWVAYWWLPFLLLLTAGGVWTAINYSPSGVEQSDNTVATTELIQRNAMGTNQEESLAKSSDETTVEATTASAGTHTMTASDQAKRSNGRNQSGLTTPVTGRLPMVSITTLSTSKPIDVSSSSPSSTSDTNIAATPSDETLDPWQRPLKRTEGSPLLATSALVPLEIAVELPSRSPIVPVPETTETAFEPQPSKCELGAAAGTNVMSEQFVGNAAEGNTQTLTDATSGAAGQHLSLNVDYRLGKGFAVGSGLEFNRTHSLLQHRMEFDTITTHPSFPDQTTKGAGTYQISHNNHLAWLSIPLRIRYERQLGRVVAGLSAGASFNTRLSATGRTLTPRGFGVPVTTEGETDQFHVSYRLEPSLRLPIGKDARWNLQLTGRLERLNFGTSQLSGTERKAWLYGTSIGVFYR